MPAAVIAESAGVVLVEDGSLLYFVDRQTGGHSIAVFVFGLLALIAGVNGGVALAGGYLFGVGLVGAAVLLLAGLVLVVRAQRRRQARPLDDLRRTIVIDRATGVLLAGDGRCLAQLPSVRFRSVFQLGSSSKALACEYPGGRVIVCRGSPFAGSIGPHLDALTARGLAGR